MQQSRYADRKPPGAMSSWHADRKPPGAMSSRQNPNMGPSRGRLMQPLTAAEEASIWKRLKSPILPLFPLLDGQKPFIPTFGVEVECLVRFNPTDLKPELLEVPSLRDRAFVIQSLCASRDAKKQIRQDIAQTLREAGALVNEVDEEESNGKWTIALDDSIDCSEQNTKDAGTYGWIGVEIKTPACNFHQQSLQHVFSIIKLLTTKYVITTNQSCGLHVHVGTRTTNGQSTIPLRTCKNLVMLMLNFEKQFDQLHPNHRIGNRYCSSLRSAFDTDDVFEVYGQVIQASTIADFCRLFEIQLHSVNFQNLAPATRLRARQGHGGQTIEFRQHQGSVDPRHVVKWVQLCVGLVHWAHHEVAIQPLMSSTFGFPQIGDREKRLKQGYEIGLADLLRVLNMDRRVINYFSNRLHTHEAPNDTQEAEEELGDQLAEQRRLQAERKTLHKHLLINTINQLNSHEAPNDNQDAEEDLSNPLADQGRLQAERVALNKDILTNTREALDRMAAAELEQSILTKWKLNTMTLRDYQTLAKLHAQYPEKKTETRSTNATATTPLQLQASENYYRSRGLETSRLKIENWCANGGWGPIKGRPVTAAEWEKRMNALGEVQARKREAAHARRRKAKPQGKNQGNVRSDEEDGEDETTEAKVAFRTRMMLWEGKVQRARTVESAGR